MKRGIDHLVLCTRDLTRARRAYGDFGFTTTPPANHPFGTANSLVQLQGNFLELLSVRDPGAIPAAAPGAFNFADRNRRFLARREGLSMLVFESVDARADQAEFADKGLQSYAPFDFERQATLPDGSTVTVGFSLAFATDPAMPEVAFFTCQQHAPEYFWKPEYQRHANTARAVVEVVMVAADPAATAAFLTALQGDDAVCVDADGVRVTTARGRITVLTPARFTARFGAPPPGPASPHFAAFRIAVADPAQTESVLAANAVAHRRDGAVIRIAAADAFGVILEFAPA